MENNERLISAAEYRAGIQHAAESILDEAAECGFADDEREIDDEVTTVADGHKWHLNYGYPLDVLAHSESNPDNHEWHIYVDEIDSDTRYHTVLRAMAFVVLRADISEKVAELLAERADESADTDTDTVN